MPMASAGGASGRLRRRNRIVKLRGEGVSFDEIAKRVGGTNGTISYYLSKYGGEDVKAKPHGKRSYHRKMAPIVLGSEVNGSGNTLADGVVINDAALLDLLWKRLTTEEKVKAIKGLED